MKVVSFFVSNQHFRGPSCLHLLGEVWRWRQQGPPKHWFSTISLHCVATLKTLLRTSPPWKP